MLRRFQNPHQKPVRLFHPGDGKHQPAIELVVGAGEVFEVDLGDQPCPHVLNELTTGHKSEPWDTSWLTPDPPARARPAAAETAHKES
jgi:hypothetical protein